jgi:carboxyl-terminal processing protease
MESREGEIEMELSGRFPVLMAIFVLAITLVHFCQMESVAPTPGRYYSESSTDGLYRPEFSRGSDSETDLFPVRFAQWTEADGLQSADAKGSIRPVALNRNSASNPPDRILPYEDTQLRLGRFQEGNFVPDDQRQAIVEPRSIPEREVQYLPNQLPDISDAGVDEILTGRYQNPATLRALRAMTSAQSQSLFREVSLRIDERSLEPSSYQSRVQRAFQNLEIALDNDTFLSAAGLSPGTLQLHELRRSLRISRDSRKVQGVHDTDLVLISAMSQAEYIAGLSASFVGFEFSSASLDTLDEFSGLELADPDSPTVSEVRELIRTTDLLDEHIVGIGLEVREDPDGLIVVRVLEGSPASEADIKAGDVVHNINGQDLRGMRLSSSVDLLKGPVGSQMSVRISRDGGGEREMILVRRTVRVWTVHGTRILEGTDVGYFALSRFSQNSPAEVEQALETLHGRGMKSLIVDVRGNPGGLLTTCVEVCDKFLPCGTIVSTKGRLRSDNVLLKATYAKTWQVPIVVLIDSDSASASEIFAAAIRENKRGLVIGTRSYGKGTVQTHFPLNSVRGDLRLTTAEFYSPAGLRMAGIGVTPDIEVKNTDILESGDGVLVEAIRAAQGPEVRNLARSSGSCASHESAAPNTATLDGIIDPGHPGTTIL